METTSKIPVHAQNESKAQPRNPRFANFCAIGALIAALMAPTFEISLSRMRLFSIMQGCWELNSESLTGICIALMALPIIYLIGANLKSQLSAKAYWLLCAAAVVSIATYFGAAEAPHTLRQYSGGLPIYMVFCLGVVVISAINGAKYDARIFVTATCLAAFLSFYSLPFVTTDYSYISGADILKISSDSFELWPKMFLFCPWIAAIAAIIFPSRTGYLVSVIVLIIPWVTFFNGAPEGWEFSRAMGMYLLCVAGVAAAAIPGSTNTYAEAEEESEPDDTQTADLTNNTNVFGYTGLGAVTTAVAILMTFQFLLSSFYPTLIYLLSIAGCCAIALYFRRSVPTITTISLGGMIVSFIILMICMSLQQKYMANGEFEQMESMNIFFILNSILLIVSLIGVVARPQNLRRTSLPVYLAIPALLFIELAWICAHTSGMMEFDESYISVSSILSKITIGGSIIVTIALICLNRNNTSRATD